MKRKEWARLDKALRPVREAVERAATEMVFHAKNSLDDDTPRPPFQSVICNLHEAVAIMATCDDKLSRSAVVELILSEFEARLRLKVERQLHPEGVRELLQSARATLDTALLLQ
jgi:hypothetical protein